MLYCSHTAEGVPAMPGVRSHVQDSGDTVSYQVIGDEFLNYIIDQNGDLLAFSDDGDLYYADWVSKNDFQAIISGIGESGKALSKDITGFFVLSDKKPIGKKDNLSPPSESDMLPLVIPIPDYLLEYSGKLMEERDLIWRESQSNMQSLQSGASSEPSKESLIERNLVVIYVRFQNESNIPELKDKEFSNSAIYDLVFNDAREGSVAHYYNTVTGGGIKFIPAKETFDAEDDGIIRVTVSGSHKNWDTYFSDFRRDVVIPALSEIAPYINFRDFTSDSALTNGEKLSIMFIIHGYESSNGGRPGIWGHAHSGADLGTFNGVKIRTYCAFGAFQGQVAAPQPFTTGIVVHELGHHSFGFIDLYDTSDNYTRGVSGYWSAMGVGSWGALPGEPGGSMPTGLDAYHLSMLFSPTSTVSETDTSAVQQFSLTGISQFVKLETSAAGQYFLLQPRGNVGYDRGIQRIAGSWGSPYGGLMIYHIDENKTLGYSNTIWKTHPFFDIEEAHGEQQHLQSAINTGAVNDLFFGSNNTFDNTTDPSSKLYDNNAAITQNRSSSISVSEITPQVTDPNTQRGSVTTSFKVGTIASGASVTSVTLNKSILDLKIGEIRTLIPTILPDNASDKRVVWGSLNPDIAEVNAGIVTAKSAGITTIRAASEANPNIYADCTVNVGTIPVLLKNVSANGEPEIAATTEISFEFDTTIAGLSAKDITISDISGAAELGAISGSGKYWKAAINVIKQGEVSVSVSSYGLYMISGSPKIIDIYGFSSNTPLITTSLLPDGVIGTAYSQTLNASGITPITWSLSNGNLPYGLSLNTSTGVIYGTPTAVGTINFTIKAENALGSHTKTLSITTNSSNIKVTGVTVTPKTASIATGTGRTLLAMVAPLNATNVSVTWRSSNTNVATVSTNGTVMGLSAGTAIITAKTNEGGFQDECTVTVSGGNNITIVYPQYSSEVEYIVSKTNGFSASNLEIVDGKAAIKKSIIKSICDKLVSGSISTIHSLPWFEASVANGEIAAIRIPVKGSLLEADYPRDIQLLKVLAPNTGEFLKYAATVSDYDDGRFTLTYTGSETPYSGYIDPKTDYYLVIFIKDGGKYDLDKTVNGVVVDPLSIVNKTSHSGLINSSGSGCSAYGYLALALMIVVPLTLRKTAYRANSLGKK